jgi:hypothetical protein
VGVLLGASFVHQAHKAGRSYRPISLDGSHPRPPRAAERGMPACTRDARCRVLSGPVYHQVPGQIIVVELWTLLAWHPYCHSRLQ